MFLKREIKLLLSPVWIKLHLNLSSLGVSTGEQPVWRRGETGVWGLPGQAEEEESQKGSLIVNLQGLLLQARGNR